MAKTPVMRSIASARRRATRFVSKGTQSGGTIHQEHAQEQTQPSAPAHTQEGDH